MECRNSLSTYVPPSITNRNSLVPFVFSSEALRTGGIFTKDFGQKKLNDTLQAQLLLSVSMLSALLRYSFEPRPDRPSSKMYTECKEESA